jgi:hypothetical protein
MQYAKLDYEAVEVNPLTKAELKPWYVLRYILHHLYMLSWCAIHFFCLH